MHPAELGADLVAFTGHKGLLGPAGTGGLWVSPHLEPASLWGFPAQRLVRSAGTDVVDAAGWLLVNIAHECGYHTGYGVITSDE